MSHGHRTAAEWIALLDDPSRRTWQRPDEVVAALALRGDETVVDVGTGSGVFARPLARALPRGRVVATDIDPELIAHVKRLAEDEGLASLEPTLIRPGETGVPPGADLVLVANVFHHLPEAHVWLAKVTRRLRPGGRVAIVEYRQMERPVGPPNDHVLPKARIDELALAAGLEDQGEVEGVLEWQHLLVYRKPERWNEDNP